MPTYRKDSEVKVVAPRSFTDHATAAEVQAAVDAKVDKMKINLSSNQYREVFSEWERLKQESSQRLQRIEQQQHQNRKEAVRPSRSRTIVANTENNSSNVVIRNLEFMKRIVGPNP